ncbi:MAG: NAD-dependent epimerase/dehydratase family protein [Dehalococcoidia bacterium]
MQEPPRTVAVTGAAGYIGRRLVERLLAEDTVERVVGIDVQPAPLAHPKLTYLRQDINSPLESAFRAAGVDAVVHLAFVLRQARGRRASRRVNVNGTANVLRACEAAGVSRFVLMSSTTVYGARSENTAPLAEDAPVRPLPGFDYGVDKAASETRCRRYAESHPDMALTVLRGCVVMGPHARNFITAALDKPLLISVRGADPAMQFVHEDDLLELLWESLRNPHPGTYNVAGPGTVRWSEVVALTGKRQIALPAPVAGALMEITWRLRLQHESPRVGLNFIRWPLTVDTSKLEHEFGYSFQHTSREALLDYMSGRSDQGHLVRR